MTNNWSSGPKTRHHTFSALEECALSIGALYLLWRTNRTTRSKYIILVSSLLECPQLRTSPQLRTAFRPVPRVFLSVSNGIRYGHSIQRINSSVAIYTNTLISHIVSVATENPNLFIYFSVVKTHHFRRSPMSLTSSTWLKKTDTAAHAISNACYFTVLPAWHI